MKLTFKSPEIVARAVKAGLTVYWPNGGYPNCRIVRCPGTDDLWVSHYGNAVGLHWPSYDVKDFFSYVPQDTEDFLATLLFCNEPEWGDEYPTVYDFAPEFVSAVEQFIAGFRETLDDLDLDVLSSSFGGNVFLSLSGHGAGFWDDSHPMGRVVHDRLVAYSGDRYRFEQLYVSNDESGLLDMSFIPSARDEYRNKAFKLL